MVELRRLDDVVGRTTLPRTVRCDLDAARAVVREGLHAPEVRRLLLPVVGDRVAWSTAKSGDADTARWTG